MTIADLKKKAESGAYVDNNARELDTFKAKYSKPKTPAQAELGNPAQINPNALGGMDILNAQTGNVNTPVEVEAAAGASLKKAGLTDAYNEWLDKQYANNSTALMDYLNARYDQDRLESRWLGVPVTLPEHMGKGAGAEEVEKAAKKAKMALKLTDEQLNDIFERTKLTGLQEANYYAGRTLSGAASSVAGAAQLAAALPYYGLSVAGGLVDRTVEAVGGNTQFENFFGDTAKNIITGDPLGANRFANYVNGLVKGKYLSQTQQTISNLAENAGAMVPAIATGNIAGMLGATAAGAEAANFAVFGSGAAGNATQRAMQEGADIGTALSYGVMSGMVEVITEKMFAGVAGMNKSGVIDDLIKGLKRNGTMRMLVDTLGEGVEEIVAEVIDPFLKRATYDQTATNADLKDLLEAAKSGVLLSLIMNGAGIAMRGGDISALMGSTEGMTEAETLRNDKYGRLGKTDIGMVDDTLNNYNQRMTDMLNIDREGSIKGLITSGLAAKEGEAFNRAFEMQGKYGRNEEITDREMRDLAKANDNEIRQDNDAEIERLAKGLAPSLSAALIDNYDNTTSPARYYLEMKNAYNAAQKGEAYKGDFLNANQISAAMQAAQSTQNNVASTKNTGYNLLNDDYIRQMIEKGEIPNVGKQSSSTNAGRENNLASVEQGGGVEARAGEAKGRRPGNFETQRATKIAANAEVQRAGKVSGQEIHLRGATSEKSFKVIPRSVWSQDESLDKIAQNYKKRGMNVVFIYGNIGLEGGGYARGAHRGNVMYINIADGEATAEQIAAHEYFHDFLDRYAQTGSKAFKKSADEVRSWAVQQLVEKIRSTYGDGIDELMNVYAETYFTDEDGNITVSADYIFEEILCDAAADIDILAGRKAETQRAPLYGETVREELNRMDEAVTRADTDDGGEKFSRKKENNNDRAKTGNQEETPEQDADSGEEHYSRVTDQNELNRLNSGETMKVYRAMQVIDGKLYPPMAAKVADEEGGRRRLVEPTEIGVWYRSDERPELADEKGYFKLDKANGDAISARYNPYFHTSKTPLNDQFSSAWERPNLVTVEAEIPVSELTSGYRAEKAKDPVGEMNWHNGPIASALKGEKARRVFLSRWARVLRVVPDSEVADVVARTLDGEGLIVPENVITPSLRAELEKRGVQISDQETAKVNNDRIVAQKEAEEKAARKAAREAARAAKKIAAKESKNQASRDDDYMAAVERGDTETAQKMVDEAAKAAGYTVKAWHQTARDFTVFNTNNPGAALNDSETPNGIFFKTNDHDIGLEGKKQMPMFLNLGRTLNFKNREEANAWYRKNVDGYDALAKKMESVIKPIEAQMQEIENQMFAAETTDEEYERLDKEWNALLEKMHVEEDKYRGQLRALLDEYFLGKNKPYDSIHLGYDGHRYVDGKRENVETYIVFSNTQAKSADPVTYDDAGNVIPLSERFNPENDDIRFSRVIYDEQAKKEHAEKAIQHFGKTYNWNETGYITQDGTRIDFSGKHDGAPGGYRTVDHRDISDALGLDYGGEDYSGAMLQFMSEGNIRISPESGGINVMIEPTKAQYERLSDFISRNRGEVIFDVDSEDGTPAYSAEWSEGTHSNKVIEDIKDYFQNGAKPKRSLISEFHSQFSRATPQQDADYLAAVERGDTQTAQRMVDEAAEAAGYTIKAYHGTDADNITTFDISKAKSSTGAAFYGEGLYFTDSRSDAEDYGNNVMNVVLRIKKPLDLDSEDWAKKIGVDNSKNIRVTKTYPEKVRKGFYELHYQTDQGGDKWYVLHDVSEMVLGNDNGLGYAQRRLFSNSVLPRDVKNLTLLAEEKGYDAVIGSGTNIGNLGREYVVFSPEQIKSADPVTYDDAGNVIPLSERFNPENDDIRYSRVTPEESTIARLEKENAKLRERAEYWQKQTKLTKPKILNHKGVGKIASDLLTEYDSISDKNELHAALFKLGNEILRGREEGHALTWERVTERAEALARDILNNSRVLVNTDEYQKYNELKKYLRNNKILYQNDGNIPDFPAWRKRHKGLNLRRNEGTPADIAYNELRERFGNALFPEDIVNPADQVIRMGEVLNGFEPVFENPYSYDMALAVEETADDIIDRLLNAAEDKSFADKQEERYQALKADSAAKLSEAKAKAEAKQAEAIKALKADNAARLREVRKQRDDKIKTLKEYYAAAKRDRAEAKADSEARSRLLRIVKRLKNRKLPAATRAMLDGYITDIDTVAKSITGKSIEKLSELRDWYTEQIENNPNFVRDEGIEKALQRLSNRKIGDMSAEEVADLTNILLGIEHEIREHNKFIESEYKKNIYEAGAQTVMDLQDVKGASLPKLNKLETEMLSPIRAIHRFVGYKDDSPLMIFANELNEGQHKMLDYQRKAYEAFNQFLEDKDFMKSLTGKHATKIKVQGITPTGEAGEAYISPAMRIALAAHAMNPQNMKHIVDGGVTIPDFDLYNKGKQAEAYSRNTRLRFTKSQLEGIAATLTPKERAFLNAVMTYFNTTSRNAINETSEALKGYSLADVENYFPINSDDAFLKNDFESLKFDGTIEGMGFLKDRIRGAANPIYLRDAVTVLNKAIVQHSRYYGLAVPLRNFNKLWNVNTRGATQDLQLDEENRPYTEDGDVINGYISSVKDAMRRAWFDAGENYIEKLVKDLSGVHKQAESFEKLLNMVRSNYAKAVLTLNLGVAVKQAASYPTAAAVLGWRPLARAMADIGRVNMDTINKYTPVQYYRSRGYSTQELGDLATRGKSMPKALNWIQGMDVVTTRKLWKASEYYVRRANRDLAVGSPAYYSAVAAIYNRVIEETQPNYTTMQRPGLLRSENALLQSLMMFKTQPFQNYNILSDSLGNLAAKRRAWKAMGTPEAKAAYKEAKRTAVKAVTSQFVANAVFVGMAAAWALFRGKTKNYKDDDDEYTWKSVMSKIGRDMVGTAAGMVPFGSEFWELVQSLAFNETYYGIETVTASALSDALSAIKKAWNSTATIIDDVKDPDKEANWNKYIFQMESVVNAISKLVGAPVENVTNLLRAVTLRTANVICDDDYEAQYVALRISTDPVTDSGAYIDNLYKAKINGAKSYTELYNLMVNAGISEDKIKTGMEKRMKAAEGVEKVGDLDERYLAPKQETIYQKALRELEQSDTYKAATDEQKKGAKSDLYDLYAQTADGKKMREKIDEGKNYDVSDTDYIEFLLSLHEHDEPTENGNYGSYTNDEIIAALKVMDVSNQEKAYLYSTKNSSKANNPWARYLPR